MSEFRPLRNFVDRWLGPPKVLKQPSPPPLPKPQPATMKKPTKEPGTISRILTHGVEQDLGVYGALPFSREQIQRSAQLTKNEAEAHEKEIHAPILLFQGKGAPIGTTSGGIGLSDQEFIRRTRMWEAEQRALLASSGRSIDEILPNASTLGVKTFHN